MDKNILDAIVLNNDVRRVKFKPSWGVRLMLTNRDEKELSDSTGKLDNFETGLLDFKLTEFGLHNLSLIIIFYIVKFKLVALYICTGEVSSICY